MGSRGKLARTRVMLAAGALLLALVTHASAQPADAKKRALEVFQSGKAHYERSDWEGAIERFWESYTIYPVPELLYSLGQAYRRAGNCARAAELLRRYLTERPDAANRTEVERTLASLDSECGPDRASAPASPSGADGSPTAVVVERGPAPLPDRAPRLAIDAEGGVAFFALGAEVDVSAQPTLGIHVSYLLTATPLAVEVGARATYTPVPWRDNERDGVRGDSAFTSAMATVAGAFPITARLAVRADLGAGVLVLSGIDTANNAFVDEGIAADGAISLFAVRAGIGAQFAISRHLVIGLSPIVLSYSPTIDGMRDSVPGLRRLEVVSSIGYRL